MTAADFAQRIRGAKRSGAGWIGCCPAHDDQRQSLTFRDGDTGLVVRCHAGCTQEAVVEAAGLTFRDLFHSSVGPTPSTRDVGERASAATATLTAPAVVRASVGRIVATYDYVDEGGRLLFQEVRKEPKAFLQRRPADDGGWIWNLDDVRLVLYHLPALAGALDAVVVEGSKDADTLRAHGLTATTNPMGAGKWRDDYTQQLVAAGVKTITVIPDNDEPGEAHALAVARSCLRAGLTVKIARLPSLPPISKKHGADVSEWLAMGHTADELRAVLDAAPPFTETTITSEDVVQPATADVDAAPAEAWPQVNAEAFYGVAGDIAQAVDPFTEADPIATLFNVLVGFGSLVGAGPHARVGHEQHPARIFGALVGKTAKGRKGTSWGTPKFLLAQADAEWRARIVAGLSSGEGLIYHVRDPREEQQPQKQGGKITGYQTVVVDHGEPDKRLFVFEQELASVLKVMARERNTLSAVVRSAWETGDLQTLTKNSPTKATGAHVCILAHITADELRGELNAMEIANGFANRFLWLLVRRSKELPDGEAVPEAQLMSLVK